MGKNGTELMIPGGLREFIRFELPQRAEPRREVRGELAVPGGEVGGYLGVHGGGCLGVAEGGWGGYGYFRRPSPLYVAYGYNRVSRFEALSR